MNQKKINQSVADFYNSWGRKYSSAWISLAKQHLSSLEINFIKSAVKLIQEKNDDQPLKTLDIGVGTGRISVAILNENVEHYGIDISQTMINYCQDKFKDNYKLKQLIVHDIINPLPESWSGFDVVTAIRILSYTKFWRQALNNIYKSLKPGGIFIFTFPNRNSLMFLSRLFWRKKYTIGGEMISQRELKKIIREVGFSKCQVIGLNRLLDIFYDWCDTKIFVNILFGIERFLTVLFGKTFLTREFYIKCKK